MRHPVSTPRRLEQQLSCAMLGGVVGLVVVPRAPDDAHPGHDEDADGMEAAAAKGLGLSIDVRGPSASDRSQVRIPERATRRVVL